MCVSVCLITSTKKASQPQLSHMLNFKTGLWCSSYVNMAALPSGVVWLWKIRETTATVKKVLFEIKHSIFLFSFLLVHNMSVSSEI